MDNHFDVIIIGAGAAGLTAGIYLSRAKVKTLILEMYLSSVLWFSLLKIFQQGIY